MSGWTAVTLHASDEETNERIDRELREAYNGGTVWTAEGYADRTVQVERGANHQTTAEILAEEFPEVEDIVVVSANDTSDSGFGTVFNVENGAVTKVDSKEGYEGAKGRDVTGYIRDEHGLKCHATWEA
jgi:hypothetical protein